MRVRKVKLHVIAAGDNNNSIESDNKNHVDCDMELFNQNEVKKRRSESDASFFGLWIFDYEREFGANFENVSAIDRKYM